MGFSIRKSSGVMAIDNVHGSQTTDEALAFDPTLLSWPDCSMKATGMMNQNM